MRKVLVADPNGAMRRALELVCVRDGLQVVAASDGAHALELFAAERPDAIVVDQALPGRSGFELAARVRQDPELRDAPVVLLVGAFEPIDREGALRTGIDEVLVKPVDFKRMVSRLRALASRRTAGDTDAYLERLSAALEERERRPVGFPPPTSSQGDEEPGPPVPTLSSILGEAAGPGGRPVGPDEGPAVSEGDRRSAQTPGRGSAPHRIE